MLLNNVRSVQLIKMIKIPTFLTPFLYHIPHLTHIAFPSYNGTWLIQHSIVRGPLQQAVVSLFSIKKLLPKNSFYINLIALPCSSSLWHWVTFLLGRARFSWIQFFFKKILIISPQKNFFKCDHICLIADLFSQPLNPLIMYYANYLVPFPFPP